jgi:SsrA-binding protein
MSSSTKVLVENRAARMEYEILESVMAGIILTGPEVKSLRLKHASLRGSYVKPINDEMVLIGAQISPYEYADNTDYDPIRTRKLLLRKGEIVALTKMAQEKGKTLVPLSIELQGRHIKVKIGIARGKNPRDRRAEIRKRDLDRELSATLKKDKY